MCIEKRKFPIVFGCGNLYIPALGPAIQSISENSNIDWYYDIYILHSHDFWIEKARKIRNNIKENILLTFIDVEDKLDGMKIQTRYHFKKECYYDIVSAEIMKTYKKYIYLDSNLIVLSDLVDLYSIELSDYVLGAVQDLLYPAMQWYVQNTLNIRPEEYFNSGVMIINQEQFQKEHIWEKIRQLTLQGKEFEYIEQDYLNIVCNKKVKYIDKRFNIELFIPDEMIGQIADPNIIHYTGARKPWGCSRSQGGSMATG